MRKAHNEARTFAALYQQSKIKNIHWCTYYEMNIWNEGSHWCINTAI